MLYNVQLHIKTLSTITITLKTYRKSLVLMPLQDAKSLQVLHIWQREFGCVVRLVRKDM